MPMDSKYFSDLLRLSVYTDACKLFSKNKTTPLNRGTAAIPFVVRKYLPLLSVGLYTSHVFSCEFVVCLCHTIIYVFFIVCLVVYI